ncbi:unnamed protein product [Adineta steineri]|uniref:Uncharacterized protein n=1 Tax=Adineta steineri TaxID=433720 RepID=A0A814SII5_9BILA|nr:unnamed protein product [Adineta steineri]
MLHQNQSNSLSPILLSPSSTTITNHITLFDNSDQGSVDSDYTSLGSSKFYGNSGSTSSLHRQGRSHSIDELASTTTIPTRHFNGTLNANKSNNDPLQFVKIHPNHDLIERAQEQLSLAESRKRLQENYKITNNSHENKVNDEEVDWSKAVENWRQKREQKRSKNVNTDNEEISISPFKIEPIRRPEEIKKPINEPIRKPIHSVPSPPIEKIKSKSPSPMRFKGPAKIHEIYIEKPIEIRGFGFKLDGGRSQNRPIIISAIEEGSPADKAGLCIDDEVISMNNENIENLTFDQVRKILKERNLRGSIKMIVKTYEDTIDDNSQTVTNGFTTDHSRTPSPPKHISTTTISPNIPVPKTNPTPNNLSPVYTFLPYTPSDSIKVNTVQQPIPTSPINILAPKPYRSTASINLDPQNNHDSNMKYTSPIEAFRRMLNSSNINKHTVNESIYDKELQDLEAEFEKQLRGIDETQKRETPVPNEKQQINLSKQPPPRVITNTPLTIVEQFPPPPPPPTLSSVQSVLYGNSTVDNNTKQQRDESPIAQVRSYVEKQMDQLQQDLEFGFSRAPKIHSPSSPTLPRTPTLARDQQRPMNIPVDYTNPSISLSPPPPLQQQQQNQQPEFLRSSLKKSLSTQNEFEQIPTNRTYGLKINPNEQVIHYLDPYPQQVSSVNFTKRSIPDLPSMTTIHRPSTAHSLERTVNELRIELPGSYSSQPQVINQQQKKVTIQLNEQIPQQRVTSKQFHTTLNQAPRQPHVDDNAWIRNNQRKTPNGHSNGRRSAPLAPHQQELQINRQPMSNYHDHHSRYEQQRNFESSPNKPNRTRSAGRTLNNERVLSVSGKLHCSRCNEELGHGSAMVIESLKLYYHIECFRCFVCNVPLTSSPEGIDVRIRNNRLHCQNCFSDENGVKLSAV